MFGFYQDKDIIPEIFESYSQKELNKIFLIFYNTLVEDELKIPYSYALRAKNIKNIFELRISDFLNNHTLAFKKASNFCSYSYKILNAYLNNQIKDYQCENKIPKNICAKMIQNVFVKGSFILNPQIAFENFVYDKIKITNPNAKIDIVDNNIIINEKMAIKACFYDNRIKDIQCALNVIRENYFNHFYIVYPRNKNFTHCEKIRYFLYENNKTMLKLVPYTINNKILRRN